MHSLLARVFERRGVKTMSDLSADERVTYEKWDTILSSGDISLDKVLEFCDTQLKLIETQWKNLDNSSVKNERLVLLHTVYATLREVIKSPAVERQNLEKYLQGLLQE